MGRSFIQRHMRRAVNILRASLDHFAGRLALGCLGFLIFWTYVLSAEPVSVWLLLALLGGGMLIAIVEFFGHAFLLERSLLAIQRALSRVLLFIALGIFLVSLVQLALSLASTMVEPARVFEGEVMLSRIFGWFRQFAGFYLTTAILVVLLLLALFAPRIDVYDQFKKISGIISKAMTVLLAVTSFTFFAALDVDQFEMGWRANLAERGEMRGKLAKIDDDARQMLAALWIAEEARQAKDQKRRDYERLFESAKAGKSPRAVVAFAAVELARTAPEVDANVAKTTLAPEDVVAPAVRDYLNDEASARPSLTQLAAAAEQLKPRETLMQRLRDIALDNAVKAVNDIVPGVDSDMINVFVHTLTGRLAKVALTNVVLGKVESIEQVKTWVGQYLAGASAPMKQAVRSTWRFDPAGLNLEAMGSVEWFPNEMQKAIEDYALRRGELMERFGGTMGPDARMPGYDPAHPRPAAPVRPPAKPVRPVIVR
jgi:hypothetical protein